MVHAFYNASAFWGVCQEAFNQSQCCFDIIGLQSEKTMFGKWKRQKTWYLPCSIKIFFFSESYQPVCPISFIDFSDKDILVHIYHWWCSSMNLWLHSERKINHFTVCVLRDHPPLNTNDHLWRQLLPAVCTWRWSTLLLWSGPADWLVPHTTTTTLLRWKIF